MITKATIKKMTRSITYQRGLDIYRSDDIIDFDLNEYVNELGDEISEIRAYANGSYHNTYEINMTVNETTSEILDSYCECPAFESYPGLCKHCAAVLMEYLDKRVGNKALQAEQDLERLLGELGVQKGSKHQKNKSYKRTTSDRVKKLLTQYALRENAIFLPESKHGQVHLEPFLTFDYGSLKLRLKIGISKMYVIKNIRQFVYDLKELHTVSYGKNLEFLHCMEAFDEESGRLAKFLLKAVDTPEVQYYRALGIPYRGESKELKLEGYWLDEFMELMKDRQLLVEYLTMTAGIEKGIYSICQKNPMEELEIQGVEDGIFILSSLMEYTQGQEYCYYITTSEKGIIYKVSLKEMEAVEDILTYLRGDGNGELFIALEDIPAFCQNVLPVLENYFTIHNENFSPEAYQPQKAEFEIYLDAPQKDMIVCKAYAVYGEKKYNICQAEMDNRKDFQLRDVRNELQVKELISKYFYAYDAASDGLALQGEDDIFQFLTEGIDILKAVGTVFVSENLKKLQVIQKVNVQVGVSMAGNLLRMQIESPQFSREQLAEILSRYEQKKKYYRLKTGEFIRMDENEIHVLQDLRDNFQLSDKQLRQKEITLPRYRALYLDSQLRGEGFQVKKAREFKQLIRDMKTAQENDFDIPESLDEILREYQKEGFLWMKTLCRNHFGGVLADDMGLGKTLQTIAFLLSEYEEEKPDQIKRTIIITPASLVYNWKSEFEKFAPGLTVRTVAGAARERELQLARLEEQVILITSYQLLCRDEEAYDKITFQYQIIDEAQFIKNQGNQTTRVVKGVNAEFRLALTGTPVENRLSELWSIFDYVMPGFLYKYQRFRKEIESPIVKSQDEESMKRLQKMIQPFILRRSKKQVLKELPDKIEKCMYARMDEKQSQLYNAHVQRLSMQLKKQTDEEFKTSKIQILAELTRLRQICCDPSLFYGNYDGESAKLELCMELIGNAVEGGHKILLFSQFTSMLDRLIKKLGEKGISYYLLTGETPKESRSRMARQFNEDETSVFCISLKAGGTGLNLVGADMVIHYDPWWNAAVETQATDRAHRIGQNQVVTVYKLIAKGTIEEKIVELQSRKKELASTVLGAEGISQAGFSRDELLELLSL